MTIPLRPGRPNGIVWIASFPRSGNTWTRSLLLNLIRVLKGSGQPATLAELSAFCPVEADARFFKAALGRPLEGLSPAQIARARSKVQLAIAGRTIGFAYLKTHAGRFLEHKTPTISPAASAGGIYLVRNPLDVAVSYAHHFAISLDQAILQMGAHAFSTAKQADFAHEVVGSWSENVASWTTPVEDALLVLRYEDAIADPFAALAAMAAHVGLRPNRLQVGVAVDFSSFRRLRADEERHGFIERPAPSETFFRSGTSDQWQDALSPAQVDRIVAAHGEQMQRFGYLP